MEKRKKTKACPGKKRGAKSVQKRRSKRVKITGRWTLKRPHRIRRHEYTSPCGRVARRQPPRLGLPGRQAHCTRQSPPLRPACLSSTCHSTWDTAWRVSLVVSLAMAWITYFLLVLMWPWRPQLAHFRVVLPRSMDGAGESGSPSWICCCSAFCFSRACRRSLLRWRRASSVSSLVGES